MRSLRLVLAASLFLSGATAAWAEIGLRVQSYYLDMGEVLRELVVFRGRSIETPENWELRVEDSSRRLVQRFVARGPIPESVPWIGIGHDGRVIKDGFYHARLSASFSSGLKLETAAEKFSFMASPDLESLRRHAFLLSEDDSKVVIRLPRLIFPSGSAELSEQAPDILDALASFLANHPNRPVYVLGYADDQGATPFNVRVSEERALRVYQFLIDHRIEPARLRHKGMADKNPIASNETSEGRTRNRRVEVWMSKLRWIGA
ncbi:MAG: OmpA family protein [Elusimicrobia bacterium]|nr:OmpA family protein [Elusimicrobiota bacterium]